MKRHNFLEERKLSKIYKKLEILKGKNCSNFEKKKLTWTKNNLKNTVYK
jgi:hypothetical protein